MNPETYWPRDVGRVVAYSGIASGLDFTATKAQRSTVTASEGTVTFAVDAKPPEFSSGLVVRVCGEESEISRCFIPWHSIGRFVVGCGMIAKARNSRNGWSIRLVGTAPRGEIVHIAWHNPVFRAP